MGSPLWFAKAAMTAVDDPARVQANMIRVRNWLVNQATPVAALEEAANRERMEFEPENARYLITYSRNAKTAVPARIWDLAQEQPLQLPQGFEPLGAASWAPRGQLLIGSAEGHVALVTMPDLRIVRRWEAEGPVRYVAVSTDGSLVAAATGRRLLVWTTAGAAQPAIAEHPAEIVYVAFAPKGSLLVTATESDAKASLFSVEDGDGNLPQLRPAIPPVTHRYRGGEGDYVSRPPLFALEGQILVTASSLTPGRIGWHDTQTGATAVSTEGGLNSLREMTMPPDGKTLAVAMGASWFYDATTHQRVSGYGGILSQAFDAAGNLFA